MKKSKSNSQKPGHAIKKFIQDGILLSAIIIIMVILIGIVINALDIKELSISLFWGWQQV